MIANRPDWCISRQRNWGVPIPFFLNKESGELHPRTVELMEVVAQRVEQEGIEAWFKLDAAELLGDEAPLYDKISDTLDVWFDSGTTHWHVLRGSHPMGHAAGPRADLYLEGSDQHRGWFHSSLLTGCAIDDHAPYRELLTHGFTVDENGRKMSKSLGNVIAPQRSTTPWAPISCVCGWPRPIIRARWPCRSRSCSVAPMPTAVSAIPHASCCRT